MLNIGTQAISTAAACSSGSMPGINKTPISTAAGWIASLAMAISDTSATMPFTPIPARLPPITNSASGPDANDSISTTRDSGVGNFRPKSAKAKPIAIASSIGFLSKRANVPPSMDSTLALL